MSKETRWCFVLCYGFILGVGNSSYKEHNVKHLIKAWTVTLDLNSEAVSINAVYNFSTLLYGAISGIAVLEETLVSCSKLKDILWDHAIKYGFYYPINIYRAASISRLYAFSYHCSSVLHCTIAASGSILLGGIEVIVRFEHITIYIS